MLSDTENLYLQGKVTYKETGKVITWYSNDGTLVLGNGKQRYLHASFCRTASQQIHYRSINI